MNVRIRPLRRQRWTSARQQTASSASAFTRCGPTNHLKLLHPPVFGAIDIDGQVDSIDIRSMPHGHVPTRRFQSDRARGFPRRVAGRDGTRAPRLAKKSSATTSSRGRDGARFMALEESGRGRTSPCVVLPHGRRTNETSLTNQRHGIRRGLGAPSTHICPSTFISLKARGCARASDARRRRKGEPRRCWR